MSDSHVRPGVRDEPAPLERIESGNPQADRILGGGFPRHSINIIMGQPGTGKTIFAEQLLFHNAGGGRPALYVTTLSEPLSKVVTYVQQFRFFDADRLGGDIEYDDLGALLVARGPAAMIEWLEEAIKTRAPRIIVIDSFRAIHDLMTSDQETRRFVGQLTALLSAYDVTTFLVGEYTDDDIRRCPEFAVADAVVQLARQPMSTRDDRYFRVLKLRGSGYREGQHAFRITADGLEMYPRLVTPRVPEEYELRDARVPTGVPGLDERLSGGLLAGSTTLVIGATGTGKTTLALQFVLEGVRRREKTLFVNFQENPPQIRRAISSLGVPPDEALAHGLALRYASPVELQIDSIVVHIFETISKDGVRRLVIDGIGDLATAVHDPQRLHDYLYSLMQHFAVNGITSLLTLESAAGRSGSRAMDERFSYMSDTVVTLSLGDAPSAHRTLRVTKMRGSAHEHGPCDFEIGPHGIRMT
jgi:circadian clock protein KaiC